MSEKQICFMCRGNGFRTVHEDTTKTNVVLIQCSNCNSNGEAFILDKEKHDHHYYSLSIVLIQHLF